MMVNGATESSNFFLLLEIDKEEDPIKVTFIRSVMGWQSIYIGDKSLSHPPIAILGEDRHSLQILVDKQKLDEQLSRELPESYPVKFELNIKIRRIFWTPLRSALVIAYYSFADNMLRLSNNVNPQSSPIDLGVGMKNSSFKFDYDESLLDIQWQVLIHW